MEKEEDALSVYSGPTEAGEWRDWRTGADRQGEREEETRARHEKDVRFLQ